MRVALRAALLDDQGRVVFAYEHGLPAVPVVE